MLSTKTALTSVLHAVVLWFAFFWVSALFVGRIYAFHEAFIQIQQELANDAKLLQLCSDIEFVAMMKQHADVCSRVQMDADINPWLKALNIALDSPSVCGRETCIELLSRFFVWGGWTGFFSSIAIALVMPQLLQSVFRYQPKKMHFVNMENDSNGMCYYPRLKTEPV